MNHIPVGESSRLRCEKGQAGGLPLLIGNTPAITYLPK